jgi:ribosome-binding protein aMBF1 (putative translation factor)
MAWVCEVCGKVEDTEEMLMNQQDVLHICTSCVEDRRDGQEGSIGG